MDKIKLDKLPTHVAIIMDGNGRWAKHKKLKRVEGHRVGMESVTRDRYYNLRTENTLSYPLCLLKRKLGATER